MTTKINDQTTETEEGEQKDFLTEVGESTDESTVPDLESKPETDTDHSDNFVPVPDEDADTFPRDYVEKLRDENARYRQKAQRADDLAQQLHALLVEKTGRLADPSDLPFDETHLEDPDALNGAIDSLLAAKPHLASRVARGDIGQGSTPDTGETSLLGIMRSLA